MNLMGLDEIHWVKVSNSSYQSQNHLPSPNQDSWLILATVLNMDSQLHNTWLLPLPLNRVCNRHISIILGIITFNVPLINGIWGITAFSGPLTPVVNKTGDVLIVFFTSLIGEKLLSI